MYLIYAGLVIFGIVVMVKVFRIQVNASNIVVQRTELLEQLRIIEAVRGNIYSDNGSLLATSIPIYTVRMDMMADGLKDEVFFDNVDSLAFGLAKIFKDKTSEEYRASLIEAKKTGNRYYLIHSKVKYPDLQRVKQLPIIRLGKNRGGYIEEKENKRTRPYGILAARLIGYERTDPENPQFITRIGIEGAFSKELTGTDGKQLMKKVGGKWRPVSDKFEVNPVDGADIHTTLDINIQDVAENALRQQLIRYEAKSGCVVLMEVKTGYVKAMANLSLGEDGEYYEHYNQAIGMSTEPGSTFKLPSLMVAIEDGLIHPDDSVKTGNGKCKYYDLTMLDTRPHGTITLQNAFEVSSNCGCSNPIFKHYSRNPEKYIEGLKDLGIDELLGLDINGEAKPYIKEASDNSFSGVTLPQMAIGYEVKLAPIQILSFYNAVANNGKMMKPQFVKEIKRNGKVVESFEPVVLKEKICSQRTIDLVKPMLEGVVERGTATNLKAANFKIAGKTGTAQILTDGSYRREKYLASFVGYFPAEDPKYSCIVSIMEPNVLTGYYGNAVAGNVFKEIADKIYSRTLEIHEKYLFDLNASHELPVTKSGMYADLKEIFSQLEIPVSASSPNLSWVSTNTSGKKVQLDSKNIEEGKIPDVKGMGLKDALFILENKGLVVQVVGSGKVRRQSLTEGQNFTKGQTITIELM